MPSPLLRTVVSVRRVLLGALTALCVAACGGGSSSQDEVADAAQPGLDAPPSADRPTGADATADPTAVRADDAGDPPIPAVADGFVAGGLLARVYPGRAADPTRLEGAPAAHELVRALDWPEEDPHLAALHGGEPFTLHVEGALRVAEAGRYRVAVTASDSAMLRLAGEQVVFFWETGRRTSVAVEVSLEAGWIPLDLVYARDPHRAHLQVRVAPVDALPVALAGDAIGLPAARPDDLPPLQVEATVEPARYYSAPLVVETNAPARVTATFSAGGDRVTGESATFARRHTIAPSLAPDRLWRIVVRAEDPWGVEAEAEPLSSQTLAVPDYTPGGLLGHYYEGRDFGTLRGIRWDRGVHLPDAADGDKSGRFGMDIPKDNFSVRWEGGLRIDTPGRWTLHFGTDDGQRVYVAGELVAELWTGHGLLYVSPEVDLAAGWHPIVLEVYDSGGHAEAHLEWSGPGTERSLVPAGHLGAVLPPGADAPPAVEDLRLTADGDGVLVRFRGTALSSAAVRLTDGDGAVHPRDLATFATGFSARFADLPAGPVEVDVTLTDLDGRQGAPARESLDR